MATSIFGIGLSGLNAAQASLASTSHNITNSASGAFHRQTAIQGTQNPQLAAGGFFGKGATVETVVRSYDRFLEGAVLQAQGQGSYLDAYNKQITQIDNLLADPTSGLSPALQTFFAGVQDVASNPASVPSRQAMISQANAMVSRFATFDSRFEQLRSGVNSEISDSITQINATAKSIADMNDQIIDSLSSDSKPANDLLDKRDALVATLNKLIHTDVINESSGSISVFIGTGQTLVIGNQSYTLNAAPSAADPKDFDISYQSGGSTTPINASNLKGGALGALLDFRTQTLDTVQNSLGRTAIVLAQTFNDQHRLGQDLNGVAGQNFFNVPTPTVLINSNNTGTAAITASNTAVGSLTGSDYRLQFSAGNWTFTRLTDNTQTVFAAFPQTIDGITLASPSGVV
ncbi:MAG: flagellar hook-associated protein FlgK, partial [Betaproteobacteria bacterium]